MDRQHEPDVSSREGTPRERQSPFLPPLPDYENPDAVEEFFFGGEGHPGRLSRMGVLKKELESGTLTDTDRTEALALVAQLRHTILSCPEGTVLPFESEKVSRAAILAQLEQDAVQLLGGAQRVKPGVSGEIIVSPEMETVVETARHQAEEAIRDPSARLEAERVRFDVLSRQLKTDEALLASLQDATGFRREDLFRKVYELSKEKAEREHALDRVVNELVRYKEGLHRESVKELCESLINPGARLRIEELRMEEDVADAIKKAPVTLTKEERASGVISPEKTILIKSVITAVRQAVVARVKRTEERSLGDRTMLERTAVQVFEPLPQSFSRPARFGYLGATLDLVALITEAST